MRTSRGAADTVRSRAAERSLTRLRRAAVAVAGLLVVIGASAVGLHDVAESHLASPQAATRA